MSKLVIPEEALDQHLIALGKTGSGKSSALRVLVEWLLDHKRRVVIITPKADWWGLKVSADGKEAGYPIVIFGGDNSDMPLHHLSGKAMAELLATGDRSAVLQMRDWMPTERTDFWIDFSANLFRLLTGKLYLVIDEVHNFAPKGKVLNPKAGMMLYWSNKLASEARGLGITLIAASQRSAKVHNDFLTSCETLLAMRVTTSWDREAVEAWIEGCGDEKIGEQVIKSLAQMKRGDAWAWSPEIEFGPKQIHFPMFSTYDSFKPQALQATKKLKGWAEVDLGEVRSKLEQFVKEAEANDPTKLRLRIRDLQKQLGAKPGKAETKEIRVADPRAIEKAVRDATAVYQKTISGILKELPGMARVLDDLSAKIAKIAGAELPKLPSITIPHSPMRNNATSPSLSAQASARPHRTIPNLARPAMPIQVGDEQLTPYQTDILRGLAEMEAIGRNDVPFALAGVAARRSATSSTFERYRSRLQALGLVSYPVPGRLALTDEGRQHAARLVNGDPPVTSENVQARALHLLTPYQQDLLRALIEVHPQAISREELGEKSGKQASSSTFERYVASLRGMELIDYAGARMVKCADWLFVD